jgi:hypothetical protein
LATACTCKGLFDFLPNRESFLDFQRHHRNVYRLEVEALGCPEESIAWIIAGIEW